VVLASKVLDMVLGSFEIKSSILEDEELLSRMGATSFVAAA
jgi:hypothetical protein